MRKKKFIFNIILTWPYIVFHSYKMLLLNQLSNISVHYLTVSWAIFKFRMHSLFCLKSSNSFTGFTLKALSREKGQQYTSTFFDKIIHLASLQASTHCNRVVIKVSETALLKNHQWLWITQSSELPNLDTFWHFTPLAHSRCWQVFVSEKSISPWFLSTPGSTPSPPPVLGPLCQPLMWERHSGTCLVAFLGKLFQAQSFNFQIQSQCLLFPSTLRPIYVSSSWISLSACRPERLPYLLHPSLLEQSVLSSGDLI